MTCTTCPNCGFDLERVEDLRLGELEISRGCNVRWRGRPVLMTASRAALVAALARAGGAIVNHDALCEIIGYDGDKANGLLATHICRIRKAFRAIDPGFDRIERRRGWGRNGGTRWRV